MKVRRSERLVDMTQYLLNHPHELISLTSFAERYESAKSSISEDLGIIKKTFKERGYGTLETIPVLQVVYCSSLKFHMKRRKNILNL